MKLYKTKKNCGKLLLGILAFCTGMILLTGCGSSSEQKQNKNEDCLLYTSDAADD